MIKTELKKGTDHEMEHTSSRRVAKKIAKDHLKERPNYYTRLDKCMPEEVNEFRLPRVVSSDALERRKIKSLMKPSKKDNGVKR